MSGKFATRWWRLFRALSVCAPLMACSHVWPSQASGGALSQSVVLLDMRHEADIVGVTERVVISAAPGAETGSAITWRVGSGGRVRRRTRKVDAVTITELVRELKASGIMTASATRTCRDCESFSGVVALDERFNGFWYPRSQVPPRLELLFWRLLGRPVP